MRRTAWLGIAVGVAFVAALIVIVVLGRKDHDRPGESQGSSLEAASIEPGRPAVESDPNSGSPSTFGPESDLASADGALSQVPVPTRNAAEPRTLTARGTVRYRGEVLTPPTVSCTAEKGGESRFLGRIEVAGARWGPLDLGVADARVLRFRIEGGGIVGQEKLVEVPPDARDLTIDFDPTVGHDLWFLVQDEQGLDIPDAEVVVSWEGGSTSARPMPTGYIHVTGCMPGFVTATATAAGHAPRSMTDIPVPTIPPETRLLVLPARGRLSGRCTYGGEAVDTFTIVARSEGVRDWFSRRDFAGVRNGTFQIDDIARGEVTVIACARGLAQSKPQRIVVGEEEAVVQLELGTAQFARGRLIDQLTSEPLPDGEVQLFVTMGSDVIAPVSEESCDRDGAFTIGGVTHTPVVLSFTAPGYSVLRRTVSSDGASDVDLGVVALARRGPLVVRLEGAERVDPTKYSFATNEVGVAPALFDQDGIVRIDAASVGPFEFQVNVPDGRSISGVTSLLPGRDWSLVIPTATRRYLDLEIVTADDAEIPSGTTAGAEYDVPGPVRLLQYAVLSEDGKVSLDGLTNNFVVRVIALDGAPMATRSGSFGEAERLSLRIVLGDRRRVRIVDREGEPVVGARIRLGVDDDQPVGFSSVSDADGECSFGGMTADAYYAQVSIGDAAQAGIPVRLPANQDEPAVVVFDPSSFVEVEFLDGEQPVAGVQAVMNDAAIGLSLDVSRRTSNEDGIARWDEIGSGLYLLGAVREGYFPLLQPVAVGERATFEIRRLANVELAFVDSNGIPLPDMAFRLTCPLYGQDVTYWAGRGWLDAARDHLMTDALGRCRLRGLPAAPFAWSREDDAEGTFEVHAGENGVVQVIVRTE